VVPESIMPSFNWMFVILTRAPAGAIPVPLPKSYAPAHGVVIPTHQAEAVIAYLAFLKQPLLSEPAELGGESPPSAQLPAKAAPAESYDATKGAALYTANCSACHQASGEGLPGVFPSLKGNDVVNADDSTTHIQAVLRGVHDTRVGGVVYSSTMPPFAATLSDAEIAAIIDHERSSWGNHGKPVSATQVAAERAKAK
jgi:cytochrome c oxidase cbb3-type subunit 2